MENDGSVLPGASLEAAAAQLSMLPSPVTPVAGDVGQTGQSAETESTTQPAAATVNWDDEAANPYIPRFKGLQGRLQQEVEGRRTERAQLEQRMAALEDQLLRASVAHLDPVQQMQVIAQKQQERQMSQQASANAQQANELEMAARQIISHQLAQQYGVSVEDMLVFPTPEAMDAYGQRMATMRRQFEQQQRQVQGADNFGSTRGVAPAPPPGPAKNMEEASANFMAAAQHLARR